MKSLLVLTDFSEASDRALAQSQLLARRLAAQVELFHKVVYPPPHPPTELLDKLDDAARFDYVLTEVLEKPEKTARAELEARRARLQAAGIPVVAHLERSGDPFERIEELVEARKPDLVVMGTHGRSGVKKWLMGSLAEKVLRHVPVDLLTLHADSPLAAVDGEMGEILVATDFSDCARRALDLAEQLRRAIGGTLALLHVVERPFLPRDSEAIAELLDFTDELYQRSRKALEAELGEREGEIILERGRAAEQIERLAEERGSSLVVVGAHGRSGIGHALVGSVAEKVVRSCRAPVWVVR